jgi:hypothetical protein
MLVKSLTLMPLGEVSSSEAAILMELKFNCKTAMQQLRCRITSRHLEVQIHILFMELLRQNFRLNQFYHLLIMAMISSFLETYSNITVESKESSTLTYYTGLSIIL